MEKKTVTFMGKYAEQRRAALESHAPKMYAEMLSEGTLEEHLAYVQDTVSGYVERCADRYRQSEEYRSTEAKDPFEAMGLLNMTVLEAEEFAYREWIAVPYENESEESEDYEDE